MENHRYGYFPDDCWELVFEKLRENDEHDLDSISLVSKRFLSISNRVKRRLSINNDTLPLLPNLFQRFRQIENTVLNVRECEDVDGLLKQIARSGVLNLKTLRFRRFAAPPRDGFRALALNKNVSNSLKVLDCSGGLSMQDNDLILIGDCFPRLEELIIYASGAKSHITDDGIDALASKLKELKEFGITGEASFITDKSLISLSTNCVKLRAIDLSILQRDSQNRVTEYGMSFVMRHSPNLTSLSLSLCWAQPPAFSFTNGNAFADGKNLHSLTMTGKLITRRNLCLVAKAHPRLKKLELNQIWCYVEYPKIHGAIKLLLQACQLTLEEVTLGLCSTRSTLTDSHISDLAQYLSNLTYINIHGIFTTMTSISFYTIIKSCPLLEILKITVHMTGTIEEMGTSSPDCLGENYRLRHLDVSGSTWVNDALLENFGQFFPNLQFLDVSYCVRLTNFGVGQVLRGCPAITELCINGLEVSDVFGRYSEQFVVNLKTLSARKTQINDDEMAVIGNKCRNLQSLDIRQCNEVTDKGVMEVVRNCAKLRDINLFRCEKVRTHILPQMVFSSPSLRKVYHGHRSWSSGCQLSLRP